MLEVQRVRHSHVGVGVGSGGAGGVAVCICALLVSDHGAVKPGVLRMGSDGELADGVRLRDAGLQDTR